MKKFLQRLLPETSPIRLAYHRARSLLAAIRYGFPASKLTVIGITGTDGKTTTVGMIAHILNENGMKTGALSTALFQVGNDVRWNPTQKTSPSPFLVQQFLRELVQAGCTHAVLECSSHGLLQGRMNHTYPQVAGITNLSEEHLDYHGTIENYLDAKAILFRMLRRNGTKVLNALDESFEILKHMHSHISITYGSPNADLQLEQIRIEGNGSSALLISYLHQSRISLQITLAIPGRFNLENALCAACCAHAVGIPLKGAYKALASFKGVPGRMERIEAGQKFSVYIDFTVTPKSYTSTLSTLKPMLHPGKRLLVLAGSCGDRMREKRPMIGSILSTFADLCVITNEDPYTERPEKIIDEVWAGINAAKTEAHRISDRLEAIRFLLNEAQEGDIVLFCGKGSDTTMMTTAGQISWNEREIIRRELLSHERAKNTDR